MIRLQRSMISGLEAGMPNPQAVRDALQSAVELEHATIPLYLYALYSLDRARNPAIADVLQSVVIEEMLHMTLASNVLNALGGAPEIDKPDFIPAYPGPLPGGVQTQLTVQLAPFSMGQLALFLEIETPEDPLNFETTLVEDETITIGEFYGAISRGIGQLGNGYFTGDVSYQVGPGLMDESIVVTDVVTAQQAIATIVEQGEGTSASPLEVVGGGYAHFYRFNQIAKGHLLVPVADPGPNPQDRYAYVGDAVPFDTGGVYPVPTNPVPPAPGTPAALLNDNFNYSYTSLLKALHDMFNGQPNRTQFNRALGLMMSLKEQAKAMMGGIPDAGVFVGPTFTYLPVNPMAVAPTPAPASGA